MPLERTYFEQAYYRLVGPHVKGLAPEIYHYDPALFAHRHGATVAAHHHAARADRGAALSRTPRGMSATTSRAPASSPPTSPFRWNEKFAGVADFANNQALRRITAELVFTDPYRVMERNRWTSPELDDVAASIRADGSAESRGGATRPPVPGVGASADPRRPAHRLGDGDGERHARHRSGIRGLWADRLRSRRLPRQSADELLFAARPCDCRRRPPRPAGLAARADPDLLAKLCRAVPAAVARPGRRRRLSERPVRRARPTRPRSPRGRSASSPSCLPTWSASPAPRSSAASSALRTMPISSRSPTAPCGPRPSSKRCGWPGCSCWSRQRFRTPADIVIEAQSRRVARLHRHPAGGAVVAVSSAASPSPKVSASAPTSTAPLTKSCV